MHRRERELTAQLRGLDPGRPPMFTNFFLELRQAKVPVSHARSTSP